MKQLLINGSILFLLALTSIACNEKVSCPDCDLQPELFQLRITDSQSSVDLIYSGHFHADSITIFFMGNGQKNYIEIEIDTDSLHSKAVIKSHEMSRKSEEGYKDYYLYLNYLDTDTIFFDAEKTPNDCCPFYSLDDFRINNVVMEIDTSANVFNFIKQID
jgi:hypothetical protein